jgi:hypothetical protein
MATNENDYEEMNVPHQEFGNKIDVVEHIEFSSSEEAIAFYQVARERLLNVNQWAKISAIRLSTFELTDSSGHNLSRIVQEGDFIKIDIPGPGTHAGDGYDWVKVESLKEESEETSEITSITVRPAAQPKGTSEETAHFFENSATSTFIVRRSGNTVFAEEHGRNEVPNTQTDHLIDNVRNTLIGWSARLGLSYPQWKSLVKGLINTDRSIS